MTKDEFGAKFNCVYKNALEKYADTTTLRNALIQYADENNKISSENLAMFALTESVKLNARIMKSVLEDILQFDD